MTEKRFKTRDEAHEYLRSLPKKVPYIHGTAEITHAIIGKDVGVGAYTVIGGQGFGFDQAGENIVRFPHNGKVILDDYVEVGANSCIDRGTIGDTYIGRHTKIDNLVHIAHNVQVGSNCLIVAGSVLGGSSEIGDRVFIGMGALIRDNIKIGANAFICMGAIVTKDVPAWEKVKPPR